MESTHFRILHVDDDPGLLELSRAFVAKFAPRFEYRTVTDPQAVMEHLDEDPVDCIVSDYEMPETDGLELLQRVRERFPALPFVLFTGKGSEEIASEAISAGVTDYLQKSPDAGQFELLVHSLRHAVERHRSDVLVRQVYDAIHQVDEGVSLVGEDGTFIYVNRSYADAFGFGAEQLVGEHWSRLYRNEADAQTVVDEVMADLSVGAPWHGKTLHPRRDGRLFYADHHLGVTEDGLVVCRVKDLGDAFEVPEHASPIVADGGVSSQETLARGDEKRESDD